jgi:hypothetical protein
MRKTNLFGLAAILLLLALGSIPAWGAGSEPVCATDGCTVPKSDPTDKCTPAYDDYALFIAGISNRESALAAYEDNPAWIRHARFIDHKWESFTRGRLAPMREWAAKEFGSALADTVFYPFSGPDFVNVFALFPHAKTYLLIALEPVGNLPDFSALNGQNFFASLQRSLYDLLQLDFFLTNKMRSSIGKSELKGTLPVLMFFLAREQARVLDVQHWAMQPDGSIAESGLGGRSNSLLLSVQSAQRFPGTQPAFCRFPEELRAGDDLRQSRLLFDVQASLFRHQTVHSGPEPRCAAR